MTTSGSEPPSASAIEAALRRATDLSPDARAVFEGVRDEAGAVIDLRIAYGNDAYWLLSGLDPATALGQTLTALVPGMDLSVGLSVRLREAIASGRPLVDRELRVRPQSGPFAGVERVFDVDMHVVGNVVAARFIDRTEVVEGANRREAESRRNAALARFLSASVDPRIERNQLLDILATEVASTLGNLCLIIDQLDDGLGVGAVAGGPPGLAETISATAIGRSLPMPDATRAGLLELRTVLYPTIPDDIREEIVGFMELLGVPADVARAIQSVAAVAIRAGDRTIGRIQAARFADDGPYTSADRETLEAMASAAALVLERRGALDSQTRIHAQFEALFEQAPVAMITVTPELGTRHNHAALELFGREREELVRLAFQPGAPWIPTGAEEAPWLDIRRRIRDGETVTGARMTLLRPAGERRDIEVSAIPITAPDGARAGVVTVLVDLTDRNSLEAQLQHAQKMEALGRLAGGIAHDFNNVLMAILGYAEFIAQDAVGGHVRVEDAEQILAATNRAIELTARLTAFARRDQSVVETADVTDLVRSLMPLLRRLAPESIELVSVLEPSPPVAVNRSEFDQVIVNLVVNAVDAMPDGGRLTIEVGAAELSAEHAAAHLDELPGEHASIAVSDSGSGMDEATKARIFEPFYTTKPVGEGTGLGLSTAFASVQRVGGRMWVYSEPGHGSTFRIYLPRVAPAEAAGSQLPRPTETPPKGDESILLLEDDLLVRDLVATVLRGLGYAVTAADRPSAAIELASAGTFDLLLTDVVMPEMMGDQVAALLRAAQPDLRVIFMSGYTARALSFDLRAGDLMLHKPIRPADLARVVRNALDARRPT